MKLGYVFLRLEVLRMYVLFYIGYIRLPEIIINIV